MYKEQFNVVFTVCFGDKVYNCVSRMCRIFIRPQQTTVSQKEGLWSVCMVFVAPDKSCPLLSSLICGRSRF
ncbi:unnamed protein product [Spodoptera littoralis]|uniref:Uncharacterized protein n=1 Tax=Spodoptera littoralis TaxID=7109 RepID=A0A9P0IDZ7_SPOLI|nr:unnamed protein product [Spodoptera littoralis]CAH1645071.1 unnamed protein product [Spodoptera littoralis]